jgi:hypothetical protein
MRWLSPERTWLLMTLPIRPDDFIARAGKFTPSDRSGT